MPVPDDDRLGLIADIGGTNARFALVHPDGTTTAPVVLSCADFENLDKAALAYLSRMATEARPAVAAFAVASAVTGDEVAMTNHNWRFSIEQTRRSLGLDRLDVVNDFVAVALAVPHLAAQDRIVLSPGQPSPGASIAVLGPGTGLGVAILIPDGQGWRAIPGEGGHVTMAACTDREAEILSWLRDRYGHVSAERILSGPGLVNLHQALQALSGETVDETVTPADVTTRAQAGHQPAREALDLFFAMLGTLSGNVALTLGARGGVVLAGGILPRMPQTLATSVFLDRFADKGRFAPYLRKIPVSLITHPFPAFKGLAGLVLG